MDAVDDTPVTLPGRRLRRAESKLEVSEAVPEPIEFENTGQIVSAVMAAGNEDLMSAFVQKAAEAFAASNGGNGNGNGGDPEKTLKEIKRHKWLAALMALLFGSGGMVGSYYALKALAASNADRVQAVEVDAKATKQRIEKNSDDIRLIRVNVNGINESVGGMKDQQTAIVDGIEDLKQENVDRLEKENAKLEREIRRLERNR